MYTRKDLMKYDFFKNILQAQRITDVLDSLTGLISKAYITNFVKSLIDAEIPFTFGMIDLDNFKYINDAYGHTMGDKMLAAVANDLQDYLGDYGVAGRFGGDEFLFINFRDITYPEKKLFCQNMFSNHEVLRKTHRIGEYELFMTGTTGLATYPSDADNYSDLFSLIDKTLYRGKSKGRNCYIIYLESKHKNIEIRRLRKNTLYETFKNLASAFDSSDDINEKIKAGYESLKSDLNITDMYYADIKTKLLKSVSDRHILGPADDIDLLMDKEAYATNKIDQIKVISPHLYETLTKNETEAVLIMKISVGSETFGYLMCAEPHTLRIWQENEYAILFLFARMAGEYIQGMHISL